MKKILLIALFIIGFSIYTNNSNNKQVIIPKEAIRFRIIANSDSNIDQTTKILVRDKIEKQLTTDLKTANNIENARSTLKTNLPIYESIVQETLSTNNMDTDFEIKYGENYFPEKEYKGVKYKEGEYESLVVTLGNGLGKNWWCVLFPPLCLLEGEETEESEQVEYKFFVKELIDKYFK